MKPSLSELFFFSRYMLPLWASGGVWLWSSGRAELIWSRFSENNRGLLILFLCAWVVAAFKVFPKVWEYEQARRDYAAAGRDPEAKRRRRRLLLWLLAYASWGSSLWWVTEQSYAANPDLYLAAFVIGAGGSLWAALAIYSRIPAPLKNRLRPSWGRKQKAFIVQCCQPVPKRSPNRKQIEAGLPDYCKLLLASKPKESMLARIQKAVEAQFLNAANS